MSMCFSVGVLYVCFYCNNSVVILSLFFDALSEDEEVIADSDKTIFNWAADGNEVKVQAFLAGGAPINAKDADGMW